LKVNQLVEVEDEPASQGLKVNQQAWSLKQNHQKARFEGDLASQDLKVNQLFEVEDEPPSQGSKVNHQAKA